MNQPTKQPLLKQARRNQRFSNAPLGMGQCALQAGEVAIFPVRYALDESPADNTSPQGPNPLPKGWKHSLPTLDTRSYTLRQLRDGWLYVWDGIDQTFHEYQVSGEHFIRHKWTDAQLNQDERSNPGPALTYLLYPRRSQLHMAFSPVQWTWRMCELMRSSPKQQSRWMRQVDLPSFCTEGTVEHGGLLTELGDSVADILLIGSAEDSAPSFATTSLPTRSNQADTPSKPAFDEALVRGRVPEQDTALFIALDDPLALVEDLQMNLTGRLLEQGLLTSEHGEKLNNARIVESLCGFDTEALIPETVKDPRQRQAYIDDLHSLILVDAEIAQGKALAPDYQASLVEMGAYTRLAAVEDPFKAKWQKLPDATLRQQALKQWEDRREWRADVRFDELRQYQRQIGAEADKLKAHSENSAADLLVWLDRLAPDAEGIFHDSGHAQQSSQLLKSATGLYTALGNSEPGQAWLCRQAERPSSLFGLAMFNFNPELHAMLRKAVDTFSRTGKLDEQGRQGDGSSPTMSLSSSDITNAATRTNELKGVLDLDSVRNSQLYRAMSDSARQALGTLFKVANDQAASAWHRLGQMLLPAFKGQTGLAYSALLVIISREFASDPKLVINPNYAREFQNWQQQVSTLTRRMHSDIRVLQHPAAYREHSAARLSLHNHQAQLKELSLLRPNQIIGQASGPGRLDIKMVHIQGWLGDLGHSEALAQYRGMGTGAYWNRTKDWMNHNKGNALPAVLVGLNLWNLHSSANKAYNDGHFSPDEWRMVSANAAYAGNALAALWVGPAWNRAGTMVGELDKGMTKLAKAGWLEWLKKANSGSAESARFAAASKSLLLRTATWAALGALASGLEAWHTAKDASNATSPEERKLLEWKRNVLTIMSGVSGTQLGSAVLGIRFGYAWVMSPAAFITLLILGIAYLLISLIASSYKREGLRLWLYRCTWGRGADPAWQGEKYRNQVQALLETLQRPNVLGKALYTGGGSTPKRHLGFWVQIQVPAILAGKELNLQPALVNNQPYGNRLQTTPYGFYAQFTGGNWIDPAQFGVLPDARLESSHQSDFIYSQAHPYRLWQTWIETSEADPVLELEISYPPGVCMQDDRRPYRFRLQMKWSTAEAERMNTPFNGEVKDGEDFVLSERSTQLLVLPVPDAAQSGS